MVKHLLFESRRRTKRIVSVTDLPSEVTTVSRVVSVWYLNVIRKTSIYLMGLRSVFRDVGRGQVIYLVIELASITVYIETLFSRLTIHSQAIVLVVILMITLISI